MSGSHNPDTAHSHGPGCGHAAIRHGSHVDYLEDGRLLHPLDGHVDEHVIEISDLNPVRCTPEHRCGDHRHGPGCGHEAVPMAIMSTIWSMAAFITRMTAIATITGLCLQPDLWSGAGYGLPLILFIESGKAPGRVPVARYAAHGPNSCARYRRAAFAGLIAGTAFYRSEEGPCAGLWPICVTLYPYIAAAAELHWF